MSSTMVMTLAATPSPSASTATLFTTTTTPTTTTTTNTMATAATDSSPISSIAPPPLLASSASAPAAKSLCANCGSDVQAGAELLDARTRIADLEAQLRLLNQKAAAAVDRWADYEDELSRLRQNQAPAPPPKEDQPPPTGGSLLQTGTSRLSALLSRKSTPDLQAAAANPPAVNAPPLPQQQQQQQQQQRRDPNKPSTEDLIKALTREKSLRKEAEGRLNDTSREVEELSVSLFEQANEMVADERRARAKLEERVDELERRDVEKRRRLERLEAAMNRIERVRALLDECGVKCLFT